MSFYEAMEYRKYTFKSEFDKAIHTLEGILKGIAFDHVINPKEIDELTHWCNLQRRFINVYPFKELIPLIEQSINDEYLSAEEKEDILWVCSRFESNNEYFDIITSDIQRLQGLLHGILADNQINEEELEGLKSWLHENEHLASTYPYDEVYSLVLSVLADKVIDEEEKKILTVFFTEFIDTKASYNINQNHKLKKELNINGICAITPDIKIENSIFCFTGASSKFKRNDIKSIIDALGGSFIDNVNKSINYLVVGDFGNPAWVFSAYGRKVERAMELRRSGHSVQIVHESDFWDVVEDLK